MQHGIHHAWPINGGVTFFSKLRVVCFSDESTWLRLVWAADAGKADAVESLLAAGVEVNVKGQGSSQTFVTFSFFWEAAGYLGNTAVSRACRRGHDSVLRVLPLGPRVKPKSLSPEVRMRGDLLRGGEGGLSSRNKSLIASG